MNRTAWLAALALILAPGPAFAQMGGMGGGMGGMGMAGMRGAGFGSVEVRRSVQVEMEGGRRLSGQIDLGTVMVYGDVGQHMIQPEKIKMIRFLKPMNDPKPDDDGPPNPPGAGMNAQMMMMRGMVNRNNAMAAQTVRAKVILHSGEEIIGTIQNAMTFRFDVDYGSIVPDMDKLRTMTFSDVERKPGSAGHGAGEPDEGSPRSARDDQDSSSAAPLYFRHANALVVRSRGGNRIALYNMENQQSLELSGPKDAPLVVTPIQSAELMALAFKGPKITRIAVADNETGWHVQELRQPAEGHVMPTVGQGIAVYNVGRHVYAFGAEAHRWDVAELPKGLQATPTVGPNSASIEGQGHIYTFTAKTGKWEHIDVRKILETTGAQKE
jgi:hypothetical protein